MNRQSLTVQQTSCLSLLTAGLSLLSLRTQQNLFPLHSHSDYIPAFQWAPPFKQKLEARVKLTWHTRYTSGQETVGSVLFSPPCRRGGKLKGLPGLTLGLPMVGVAWFAASLNLWVETPMSCLRYLYYWFVTVTKQSQLQSSNEIILWLGVRTPRNCIKGCSINRVPNLCSREYSPSWLTLPNPLPSQRKTTALIANSGFPHNPFPSTKAQDGP